MAVQLNLEPPLLERAHARAKAEGKTLEAYLEELLRGLLLEVGWRGDLYAERIDRIRDDIERSTREWDARTAGTP
jgi:hypothetical protein